MHPHQRHHHRLRQTSGHGRCDHTISENALCLYRLRNHETRISKELENIQLSMMMIRTFPSHLPATMRAGRCCTSAWQQHALQSITGASTWVCLSRKSSVLRMGSAHHSARWQHAFWERLKQLVTCCLRSPFVGRTPTSLVMATSAIAAREKIWCVTHAFAAPGSN